MGGNRERRKAGGPEEKASENAGEVENEKAEEEHQKGGERGRSNACSKPE